MAKLWTSLKDIDEGIKMVTSFSAEKCHDFQKYSGVFLFGTENQQGVNDVVSYKGKDVVTVASSGDHYLSAVYFEANKVDIFDINRMTYYMTCLKIAAVCELDYEEFLDFFLPLKDDGSLNPNFWKLSVFKKLIRGLPTFVAVFWDRVIYYFHKGKSGCFVFPDDERFLPSIVKKGMPFYQSKECYYELQGLLRKREYPHFVESDISSLETALTSSYDLMYLSNILSCNVAKRLQKYIFGSRGLEDEFEKVEYEKIMQTIIPCLNENGIVLFDYRYNAKKEEQSDWLYNSDFDCTSIEAKDSGYEGDTDLILTLKMK